MSSVLGQKSIAPLPCVLTRTGCGFLLNKLLKMWLTTALHQLVKRKVQKWPPPLQLPQCSVKVDDENLNAGETEALYIEDFLFNEACNSVLWLLVMLLQASVGGEAVNKALHSILHLLWHFFCGRKFVQKLLAKVICHLPFWPIYISSIHAGCCSNYAG